MIQQNMILTLVLFISMSTSPVFCHSMEDGKRLLADKLNGYDKTFRPVSNQSAPVILYTGMELVSIQEFDEVKETLTITAVIVLNSIDECIQWNPKDYGGLKELVMESENVWTPNLILTNNVKKIKKVGDSWQIIRFFSTGISYYYPGDVFSASCKVDVTYYPWDRHRCCFNFAVWAYTIDEVAFLPSLEKVKTTYFSENGAWKFYDSDVELYSNGAFLEFCLHLERKPRFVLVNVILPVIFMGFLNTVIFLIPVECGERISYTITMLLAISVFLTLVGDNLPKTSSPMSIFSYYLLLVLLVSIGITLATIFNVRLYYVNVSEPVTGCFARFTRCITCKCPGWRSKTKRMYRKSSSLEDRHTATRVTCATQVNENLNSCANGYVSPGYARPVVLGEGNSFYARTIKRYLQDRNPHSDDTDEETDRRSLHDQDVTWKDVSAAFDKFFFTLSMVILIAATSLLFCALVLSDSR